MIRDFLNGEYIIVSIVVTVLFIIPFIVYLLLIQNTLKLISSENRKMNPRAVWICLIPVYGAIWHFFVVKAISDSLRPEFNKLSIQINEAQPGYMLGIAMCILLAAGVIPDAGGALFVAGYVCWILYWIKIANYKSRIEHGKMRVMNEE